MGLPRIGRMNIPLIFHLPLTGQKYLGICSCAVSKNVLLRTRIGSILLSKSSAAGVNFRVSCSRFSAS